MDSNKTEKENLKELQDRIENDFYVEKEIRDRKNAEAGRSVSSHPDDSPSNQESTPNNENAKYENVNNENVDLG